MCDFSRLLICFPNCSDNSGACLGMEMQELNEIEIRRKYSLFIASLLWVKKSETNVTTIPSGLISGTVYSPSSANESRWVTRVRLSSSGCDKESSPSYKTNFVWQYLTALVLNFNRFPATA